MTTKAATPPQKTNAKRTADAAEQAVKDFDRRAKYAGERIAATVIRAKGAAWDMFTDDIRREFIAARVFHEATGSGIPTVSVAMIESFYAAACEAAGV